MILFCRQLLNERLTLQSKQTTGKSGQFLKWDFLKAVYLFTDPKYDKLDAVMSNVKSQ